MAQFSIQMQTLATEIKPSYWKQILATEMYKLVNKLSPPIIDRVFKPNSDIRYNLRQISQFSRSQLRSVYHRSISYLGPKIWDILPRL